jgi:hypothetical protein
LSENKTLSLRQRMMVAHRATALLAGNKWLCIVAIGILAMAPTGRAYMLPSHLPRSTAASSRTAMSLGPSGDGDTTRRWLGWWRGFGRLFIRDHCSIEIVWLHVANSPCSPGTCGFLVCRTDSRPPTRDRRRDAVSIAAAGLGLFLSQPAVADTCSRKDCQPKANYVDAEEVRLIGCCPEQGPASRTSWDAETHMHALVVVGAPTEEARDCKPPPSRRSLSCTCTAWTRGVCEWRRSCTAACTCERESG